MKLELDDNARSGFHYLVLGVAIVGALALLNMCLDLAFPGLGPQGAFSHGYAIADDGHATITALTTRAERMMTALLLAFLLALITAIVLLPVWRALNGNPRWRFLAAKAVFVLGLGYWGYAAIALPPRQFVGNRDGMFILWERDVLVNDLPWPREKRILLIPFHTVRSTEVTAEKERGNLLIQLDLLSGEPVIIGRSGAVTVSDTSVYTYAEQRAANIRSMMTAP